MQHYKSVAVIIVNWNNRWATSCCIRSLQRMVYTNYFIIVVDNGSTDGSIDYLTRQYPDIAMIEMKRNTGFGKGANAGIRHALDHNADFLWILNNDTQVTPNSLLALVLSMERDTDAGMAGSVLIESTNGHRTRVGGGRVNFITGIPSNRTGKNTADKLDFIKGASILLRSQAIDIKGGACFDESYFLYWEDTDLGFRLRARGWKLIVVPDSIVIHDGYGSMTHESPGWDYYFTRSSLIFFLAHARLPLLPICVSVIGRMTLRLMRGQWSNATALLKALFVPGSGPFPPGAPDTSKGSLQ
ncbi:MAG: glycosyltransferase family 2 protein [Pseudomonadota bacterium]